MKMMKLQEKTTVNAELISAVLVEGDTVFVVMSNGHSYPVTRPDLASWTVEAIYDWVIRTLADA